MEAIDIEAKTIDEAIENACRKFQTSREKLKIEIIAEGNPGFLGFGSKKALIKASILEIDRELDNLLNNDDLSTPDILPPAAPPPIVAKPPSPEKRKPEPRQPVVAKSSGQPEAVRALELLEGILTRMSIPARVKLQETDEAVMLKISGDGDGLLIGKKGQNLDAIQYIVNKAVHHSINDGKRILIDTEEYRKKREDTLLTTALQTAQKVKKTHKPITLGPMNPHDRRIIHLALKNDKALTTKSRGEGEFRKIVIIPTRRGAADESI